MHDEKGEDIYMIDGKPARFVTPIDDNRKFAIKDYRDKLYEALIKERRERRKRILLRNKAYKKK